MLISCRAMLHRSSLPRISTVSAVVMSRLSSPSALGWQPSKAAQLSVKGEGGCQAERWLPAGAPHRCLQPGQLSGQRNQAARGTGILLLCMLSRRTRRRSSPSCQHFAGIQGPPRWWLELAEHHAAPSSWWAAPASRLVQCEIAVQSCCAAGRLWSPAWRQSES